MIIILPTSSEDMAMLAHAADVNVTGIRYHFMRLIVVYEQDWPYDYNTFSPTLPLGCRTNDLVREGEREGKKIFSILPPLSRRQHWAAVGHWKMASQ